MLFKDRKCAENNRKDIRVNREWSIYESICYNKFSGVTVNFFLSLSIF